MKVMTYMTGISSGKDVDGKIKLSSQSVVD